MNDTLIIAAVIDSLRETVRHAGHHTSGMGEVGKWGGLLAGAILLARLEKVGEIVMRILEVLGLRKGSPKRDTVVMEKPSTNGYVSKSFCDTSMMKLSSEITNIIDMSNKHHEEQRDDMREIRALLLRSQR